MTAIMIVEDSISLLRLFEMALSTSGYEIVSKANNGKEAILFFNHLKRKPKVIIMDYRMPIMNGIEASKEIYRIDGSVKIVITSADKRVESEAIKNSFFFLEKPFQLSNLLEIVKQALNSPIISS